MKKVIAAINMTLDGFCDHTAIIPDEEIHQHYTELLNKENVLSKKSNNFALNK
jgi:hypothetical protein